MCNVLVRDRINAVYLLAVQDDGTPFTIAIPDVNYRGALLPILTSSFGKNWMIQAGIDGSIRTVLTNISGIDYIPLFSPLGFTFKFFVLDDGSVGTISTGTLLPDSIPRPIDISMSVWPVSAGVVCATCANASVTVGADFSAWCCACNAFVLADDTTILVALEE